MAYIIKAAFFIFFFWRIRRATRNAAELAASGVSKTYLYQVSLALAFSSVVLALLVTRLEPSETRQIVLLAAIVCFVTGIIGRIALKRRHFV